MTRMTSAMSSPTRAWKIAECSLSTGSTRAPWRRAVSSSNGPAVTSDSLLASATLPGPKHSPQPVMPSSVVSFTRIQ